jgi:hypothetical protein
MATNGQSGVGGIAPATGGISTVSGGPTANPLQNGTAMTNHISVDNQVRANIQTQNWRLCLDNGRWWYWTPQNSWMYYDNGNWVNYNAGGPNVR